MAGRLGTARYAIRHPRGAQWGWSSSRTGSAGTSQANTVRLRGRHLLDHDALTCLLVLLFVDEPKLNTSRLHRVLRNLCYHSQTRTWVIRALLSILQRTSECRMEEGQTNSITATVGGASGIGKSSDKSKRKSTTSVVCGEASPQVRSGGEGSSGRSTQPSWLSISLDAALGCRANVFQIQRGGGKKHTSAVHTVVSIHPQAAPIICRHVLDTLISLAKSFPCQFLPQAKAKEAKCEESKDSTNNKSNKEAANASTDSQIAGSQRSIVCTQTSPARSQTSLPSTQTKAERSDSSTGGKSESSSREKDSVRGDTDFWDLLVRLDNLSVSRKGKGFQRLHSSGSVEGDVGMQTFEGSPLGQLMMMLAHPVVRRSQLLTDRLLRLLGLVSVGLPDITSANNATTSAADSSTLTTTLSTATTPSEFCFSLCTNNINGSYLVADLNSMRCSTSWT